MQGKYKIVPDWSMPKGKPRRNGQFVRIHPHTLIRWVHRKWGIVKAAEIATVLIRKKYDKAFNELEFKFI
ncbi:hypothetical protein [Reichenbachiella versicolor]|uniref:hypothetical protein n=1 Tax=Reichenbachiella versicolor TaxID=1821036 RepID=UPI000D6E018E|nr:hypothetical protein [Reichenbachiella versicolor]